MTLALKPVSTCVSYPFMEVDATSRTACPRMAAGSRFLLGQCGVASAAHGTPPDGLRRHPRFAGPTDGGLLMALEGGSAPSLGKATRDLEYHWERSRTLRLGLPSSFVAGTFISSFHWTGLIPQVDSHQIATTLPLSDRQGMLAIPARVNRNGQSAHGVQCCGIPGGWPYLVRISAMTRALSLVGTQRTISDHPCECRHARCRDWRTRRSIASMRRCSAVVRRRSSSA